MDLSELDSVKAAEQGAAMELLHPVSKAPLKQADGTPITITLAGTDSDRFRKAEREKANRRLNATTRKPLDVDTFKADGIDLLVACTITWSGIKVAGELLDCTPANAARVYKEFPWIKEQVDAFAAERSNFLKA